MTNADNASSEFNKHIKDVGKTVEIHVAYLCPLAGCRECKGGNQCCLALVERVFENRTVPIIV